MKESTRLSLLQLTWLVLAALLVLQAILAAPGSLAAVQSEWQVQQAYLAARTWLTMPVFGLLVSSLRVVVLVACLAVSGLLAWRRSPHLIAWFAAFALLGLPGLVSQGGETVAAAGSLLEILTGLQRFLSLLSLPALLLLFLLFPDGRFYPARLRLPVLVLLAVLAVLMGLSALQLELDWAWGILMVLFLALLLTALYSQLQRFRAAGAEAHRVLRPVLLSLGLFPLWLVLSFGLGGILGVGDLVSLAAGHLAVLSVPLALAWDVLRWDLWQARPGLAARRIFLAAAGVLVIAAPLSLFGLYSQRQQQEARLLQQTREALETARPRPVIVDADMALSDILALIFLLNHPGVDMRAITVSGTGEAHCAAGVRHALGLLEQSGAGDVPVACGRETPLVGTQEFPAAWRARVDRLYGLALPQTDRQPAAQNAAALILDTVSAYTEKVTLIALGPLTNLAEALQADPGLAQRLEMVYIMGGAVDVSGNVGPSTPEIDNPYAEWNIYADPHAASLVLQSGVPTTWVGLDATRFAPINQAFYDRLSASHDTQSALFAFNLLYVNQGMVLSPGYHFWDELTAAVALDENLARVEPVSLSIIETPGPELGRTIRDPQGSPARLVTWADGPGFERIFLLVLNRR